MYSKSQSNISRLIGLNVLHGTLDETKNNEDKIAEIDGATRELSSSQNDLGLDLFFFVKKGISNGTN